MKTTRKKAQLLFIDRVWFYQQYIVYIYTFSSQLFVEAPLALQTFLPAQTQSRKEGEKNIINKRKKKNTNENYVCVENVKT